MQRIGKGLTAALRRQPESLKRLGCAGPLGKQRGPAAPQSQDEPAPSRLGWTGCLTCRGGRTGGRGQGGVSWNSSELLSCAGSWGWQTQGRALCWSSMGCWGQRLVAKRLWKAVWQFAKGLSTYLPHGQPLLPQAFAQETEGVRPWKSWFTSTHSTSSGHITKLRRQRLTRWIPPRSSELLCASPRPKGALGSAAGPLHYFLFCCC